MSFEFFGSGDRTAVTTALEQDFSDLRGSSRDPEAAKSLENLILAGATVMRTVSAVGNERQMCSQEITDAACQ
jgi:hypothetical protein